MTIIFIICIAVILISSVWLWALWHETRRRWIKALGENVKLKKALLRISAEANLGGEWVVPIQSVQKTLDYAGRAVRIRKMAEDALGENKIGLLPHISPDDMPPMPKVKPPKKGEEQNGN